MSFNRRYGKKNVFVTRTGCGVFTISIQLEIVVQNQRRSVVRHLHTQIRTILQMMKKMLKMKTNDAKFAF